MTFIPMSAYHYGRFGVCSFIISMHVKTVQIEFYAIEIIISIHISSLKNVWLKWENWQKKNPDFTYWKSVFLDIFCSILSVLLDAPEISSWGPGPNPTFHHWELGLGAMVCPSQNSDFLKIFFTNRILPIQAKSWKWVMFKTLLCQPKWF